MENRPEIVIEAGTDIAMVGLWDLAQDREALPAHPSIAQLEAAARDADLFYVETGADGSFEAWIYVEEDVPEPLLACTSPRGEAFGLNAPTGRLCFGGVEDYRRRVKQITGDGDEFQVPPGAYTVQCRALDMEVPRRRIAEFLGEEEFGVWVAYERNTNRACLLGLAALAGAGVVGVQVSWWFALTALVILIGVLVLWEKFSDPRGQEVDRKVMEFTGDKSLDELEEEFAMARPTLTLALRRVSDGARPSGGFVSLWPPGT